MLEGAAERFELVCGRTGAPADAFAKRQELRAFQTLSARVGAVQINVLIAISLLGGIQFIEYTFVPLHLIRHILENANQLQ